MQKIQRKAFTLVELLVVVVIIAMLMGLLTPAIVAARARARQVQCMNNMNEIGKALIQFDLSKQRFPGYAEKMPGQPNVAVNWAIMILPYIRNDIWDMLRDGELINKTNNIEIELFACPSDHDQSSNQQSYVVNTGVQDASNDAAVPDWPANGVFLDICWNKNYKLTASQIPDGAQHTLLVSENLDAGAWNEVVDTSLSGYFQELLDMETQVGMVWWYNYNTAGLSDVDKKWIKINGKDDTNSSSPIYKARPSSNHSGGVNVVFCDGHSQFLSDSIDYLIYGLLMSPDGKNAKYFDSSTGWNSFDKLDTWVTTPLNEDDYAD